MSEERRVINRVPENTILDSSNALKFLDGEIEALTEGIEILHNGSKLEPDVHYKIVKKEEGEKVMYELHMKVQLQPNDRIRVG
jgi:hypothetical protein